MYNYFDLALTWFNGTSVPLLFSAANEEGLDASQYNSVASHSVNFSDPIINDDLDSDPVPISEEVDTSISEEGGTTISEEGDTSVSEEDGTSASEEGQSIVSEEEHPQVLRFNQLNPRKS